MSDLARKFISSVIAEKSMVSFLEYGDLEPIFTYDETGLNLYKALKQHVGDFGHTPSYDAFKKATNEDLIEGEDGAEYYLAQLRKRHIHRSIAAVSEGVNELLKNKQPTEALEQLTTLTTELNYVATKQRVFDFRDIHGIIWPKLKTAWNPEYMVGTGWPYLDNQSGGGLIGGDLVSIVGRPAMGKSWFMLFIALYMWSQGIPVLFVSMEMSVSIIFTRLAAMVTGMPMKMVQSGHFPNLFPISEKGGAADFKDKLTGAVSDKGVPFYIVDGNLTATVAETTALCRYLGVKACLIDGAYLLQLPSVRDRYQRVAENCRLLKQQLAAGCNIPVVASWQFSREADKFKKNEKPGLSEIAYSDEIGQLSSLALGLFDDGANGSLTRRLINVIKGRKGEQGSFYVNWDFQKMDFGESASPLGQELLSML